jgi:ABC-type branched-subunit amino acid transport system ATPase component
MMSTSADDFSVRTGPSYVSKELGVFLNLTVRENLVMVAHRGRWPQ